MTTIVFYGLKVLALHSLAPPESPPYTIIRAELTVLSSSGVAQVATRLAPSLPPTPNAWSGVVHTIPNAVLTF